MFMLKKTAFSFLFVLAACVFSCAQQKESKRPSPPARTQCKFSDGKTITVDYSSPRVRGRKIFGELVPYGEVWRTGANEATTFVVDENFITAEGISLPAGSYTIFTVPNPDRWMLIINKHTGEWGIPYIRSHRRKLYDAHELGAHASIRGVYGEEYRLATHKLSHGTDQLD